jgi:LemA protein
MFVAIVVSLLVITILGWIALSYNGLVRKRNMVREAWSGIDVQLKRRHDLIPNVIETVKGFAKQEENIFSEVTRLRSAAMQAGTPQDKGQAENALSAGLNRIFAISEAYPELKSSENFLDLQKQLQGVEHELQLARRYYNGTTRDYNTAIESFPTLFVAGAMGFKAAGFFELEDPSERSVPKVAF